MFFGKTKHYSIKWRLPVFQKSRNLLVKTKRYIMIRCDFRKRVSCHHSITSFTKDSRKLLGNHDKFEIGRCCYHFDFSHFEKKIISNANLINGAALQWGYWDKCSCFLSRSTLWTTTVRLFSIFWWTIRWLSMCYIEQ